MKFIIPIMLSILACSSFPVSNKSELENNQKPKSNYSALLSRVDSIKNSCKTKATSECGVVFSKLVGEEIVPHWIGTAWDFNGVTQVPNEGYIACGYLVTTILRDAGIKINRVKMAQCASEQMISSLTTQKENYSKLSFSDFITKVKSKGIGISIMGLDNHTGFLYFDGKELYFIHSSYVGTGKVAKEIAAENGILMNSKYKVVGYISQDEQFLKGWLR